MNYSTPPSLFFVVIICVIIILIVITITIIIQVGDEKEVAKLGMDDSPNLVYYENGIPNLYDDR